MIVAWRRARASASSAASLCISLMSLPAQKARPRPATTSTRTSSIAATRSSASSSALVSRRLSAFSASGRLSRSQATPSCASTSTIGSGAIGPAPAARGEGEGGHGAERDAGRRGGGEGPEIRPEERKNEERRPAGTRRDSPVEEPLDEVHRLRHQHFGGGLGERRVRPLGKRIARRRKRAIGLVDQIGTDQQHQRRLPPAAVGVLGERLPFLVGQRTPERR